MRSVRRIASELEVIDDRQQFSEKLSLTSVCRFGFLVFRTPTVVLIFCGQPQSRVAFYLEFALEPSSFPCEVVEEGGLVVKIVRPRGWKISIRRFFRFSVLIRDFHY
jgi:hypothetical protein